MRLPFLWAFGLAGCALSLALAGSGAASRQGVTAGPVFRLNFYFSTVGKSRPPNIVETRRVGKGTLDFDRTLYESEDYTEASDAKGKVVIEYDVLTPHPRTERLTLAVTSGKYRSFPGEGQDAHIRVEVTGSTSSACLKGTTGEVDLSVGKTHNGVVVLLDCAIFEGQTAGKGRNSRVQVRLTPHCLARKPASLEATPLCVTTFRLVDKLTEVQNPNSNELTIDPKAGTGMDDHTGKNGGAGNGGDWKVSYTWDVPDKIVPGTKAAVTLGINETFANPARQNSYEINLLGPGFAQAFTIHAATQTKGSQKFEIPIAEDENDAQELVFTVGMLSAHVIYHYLPA